MMIEILKYNFNRRRKKIDENILILNSDDEILQILIKNKNEVEFNFILILKYLYNDLNFDLNNNLEKDLYTILNFNEIELRWAILKNFQILLESIINELVGFDIDLLKKKDIWIGKNLDSFFNIEFSHLDLNENVLKKLLIRTKDYDLKYKIIIYNLVVSTLERSKKIIFFNKLKKKNYPSDLLNSINFTKGYLICVPWDLIIIFKKLLYVRKYPLNSPLKIKILKSTSFLDSLKNETYNSSIWLKKISLSDVINYKYKLYVHLNNEDVIFNKNYDINKIINIINYLNSIKLKYNKKMFDTIFAILNDDFIFQKSSITKNSLKGDIYMLNFTNEEEVIFLDEKNNSQNLIASFAILELIKKQLSRFDYFYLSYRFDSRMRIYVYQWPINYQLNHIVRNILLIENKLDVDVLYTNFINHWIVKEYFNKNYLFLYSNTLLIDKIINFINDFFIWKIDLTIEKNSIKTLLKLECFIINLIKISPSNLQNLEEKIIFSLNEFNNFLNSNLQFDWEIWLKKLKLKKKKLPYLINYQYILKNIKNDNFEGIWWGDASSNAIQLISFRLGVENETLLKVTNIIDNDTKHKNIYSYITNKIHSVDHETFLKTINYKLSSGELNSLQTDDVSKYSIMPASYGMGKFSNLINIENEVFNENNCETWDKLNVIEKKKVSNYLWDLTFDNLKEIGFDINFYKQKCKEVCTKDKDIFIWENDYEFLVAPLTLLTSVRQEKILKLNQLKFKLKTSTEEKKINEYKEKIIKLAKKLENDSSFFWKRTMIKTKDHNIFARIYHPKKKLIKRADIKQSAIPNSIHSYDASIIALMIEICQNLNIEILVIHDSIGCEILYAPFVRMLFKVVNIHMIKKFKEKPKFPFYDSDHIKYDDLFYSKILKSNFFFS